MHGRQSHTDNPIIVVLFGVRRGIVAEETIVFVNLVCRRGGPMTDADSPEISEIESKFD